MHAFVSGTSVSSGLVAQGLRAGLHGELQEYYKLIAVLQAQLQVHLLLYKFSCLPFNLISNQLDYTGSCKEYRKVIAGATF